MADYPHGSTIAGLFRRQAALTPDVIALIHHDTQLTYREVDTLTDRIAQTLQSVGVKAETLVGVFAEQTEMLVICLLAVLKAGGAYVPLDTSYPAARLSLMIEDSSMPILLTTRAARTQLPQQSTNVKYMQVEDCVHPPQPPHELAPTVSPTQLAYVMYTSGSTGKPKGVMVEHRNVVNFFTGMDAVIGPNPGIWLAVTSVAFDISVLELLWTLTRGFTVVIHSGQGAAAIADEILRHHITHLQMTPSLARTLTLNNKDLSALASLSHLLLGGETVSSALIQSLREVMAGKIYNMYGPTETTIWSTSYQVHEPGATVPIGKPIANTQVYLLDADDRPVPTGETGELYIGGDGVARGYWRQPVNSPQRFLTVPSISDRPLYRTGDLAYFCPDGNLEFVGRADDQIKLRGHRIDPAEIETILERCPGVDQAIVAVREDRAGDRRLTAYLVAHANASINLNAIRQSLTTRLPAPMIPSAYFIVPALPLTENGKTNRNALAQIPLSLLAPPSVLPISERSPANEIQNIVAQAWRDALGTSNIQLDENFFDLGAHSLTVVEVHARLQTALERTIPLIELFQYSTIRSLANHLAGVPSLSPPSYRAQQRRAAREH